MCCLQSDDEVVESDADDSDSMPPLEVDNNDSDGDGDEPSDQFAFGLKPGLKPGGMHDEQPLV